MFTGVFDLVLGKMLRVMLSGVPGLMMRFVVFESGSLCLRHRQR